MHVVILLAYEYLLIRVVIHELWLLLAAYVFDIVVCVMAT